MISRSDEETWFHSKRHEFRSISFWFWIPVPLSLTHIIAFTHLLTFTWSHCNILLTAFFLISIWPWCSPWQTQYTHPRQVVEAPGYDSVVIKSHVEGHKSWSHADAATVRRDLWGWKAMYNILDLKCTCYLRRGGSIQCPSFDSCCCFPCLTEFTLSFRSHIRLNIFFPRSGYNLYYYERKKCCMRHYEMAIRNIMKSLF